jgi:hypothetical protein
LADLLEDFSMATEHRTFGSGNLDLDAAAFVDRRTPSTNQLAPGPERRQFSDSYQDLSPDAAELGNAIDSYKLMNRRRYITYEEMISIVKSLGYSKS